MEVEPKNWPVVFSLSYKITPYLLGLYTTKEMSIDRMLTDTPFTFARLRHICTFPVGMYTNSKSSSALLGMLNTTERMAIHLSHESRSFMIAKLGSEYYIYSPQTLSKVSYQHIIGELLKMRKMGCRFCYYAIPSDNQLKANYVQIVNAFNQTTSSTVDEFEKSRYSTSYHGTWLEDLSTMRRNHLKKFNKLAKFTAQEETIKMLETKKKSLVHRGEALDGLMIKDTKKKKKMVIHNLTVQVESKKNEKRLTLLDEVLDHAKETLEKIEGEEVPPFPYELNYQLSLIHAHLMINKEKLFSGFPL